MAPIIYTCSCGHSCIRKPPGRLCPKCGEDMATEWDEAGDWDDAFRDYDGYITDEEDEG